MKKYGWRIFVCLLLCLLFFGCSAAPFALPTQPLPLQTPESTLPPVTRSTEAPTDILLVPPVPEERMEAPGDREEIVVAVLDVVVENRQEEPPTLITGVEEEPVATPTPTPMHIPTSQERMASDPEQMERVYANIYAKIAQYQERAGAAQAHYWITYENGEIVSLIAEITWSDGHETIVQPMTFSVKTGEECRLADFFIDPQSGWGGVLADVVSAAARAQGITLLSEVPPVREDQLYYISSEGEIVLFYRPYEIATYQDGFPCFTMPMNRIAGYLSGSYGIKATAMEE